MQYTNFAQQEVSIDSIGSLLEIVSAPRIASRGFSIVRPKILFRTTLFTFSLLRYHDVCTISNDASETNLYLETF